MSLREALTELLDAAPEELDGDDLLVWLTGQLNKSGIAQLVAYGPLITDDEHRVVELLASAANLYCEKVCGGGEARDQDIAEFFAHIHDAQRAVLKQAAARAYPNRYRRAGMVIPMARIDRPQVTP